MHTDGLTAAFLCWDTLANECTASKEEGLGGGSGPQVFCRFLPTVQRQLSVGADVTELPVVHEATEELNGI